jgi:hypothetical protein
MDSAEPAAKINYMVAKKKWVDSSAIWEANCII